MNKKFSRSAAGFTLIELLVVIAIIGILSAVVLASLNSARSKGANAAIKSDLQSIRDEAEIWYDGTGGNTYGSALTAAAGTPCPGTGASNMFLNDTKISSAISNAVVAAGGTGYTGSVCSTDSANAYFVIVPLKIAEGANNYWCIDSSGQSKGEPANAAGTGYVAASFTCL